jgi:glutaminyl-tRNA synthetase
MTYLVMSKRKLLQLVKEKLVNGWDDPRMPTISGLRRRGVPASAIREFARRIGVSKAESLIEMDIFEACIREDLDESAARTMAVIHPLKIVITNLPDGHKEELHASNHPKKPEMGKRNIYFTKEIYIEKSDFMEFADPDFFRLKPGGEVRLRNAYVIQCQQVIKNAAGEIQELHCTYDPVTLGGKAPADGRKVKGIIHWVSATESATVEVRLYGRLFNVADPEVVPEGQDFKSNLNPHSLEIVENARVEKGLLAAQAEQRFQFERMGYFMLDKESQASKLVFNRIVDLAGK